MKKILASLVVTFGLATPSLAQSLDDWYIGVAAVDAEYSSGSVDVEDVGYALTLGYSFDALEGFETAAEFTYSDLISMDISTSVLRSELELTSMDVSIVVAKQLERVSPFLRLGYSRASADVSAFDGTTSVSGSDDEDGFLYGLGLDVPIADKSAIRFEYSMADYDTDVLRLGLVSRF
jgi:opacity protein-like surface antigen